MAPLIDPSICQWETTSFLIFSGNVFGDYIYYSHLFPAIAALILGVFVWLRSPRSPLHITLFTVTLFFSTWVFFDLILWATEKVEYIMFFWSAQIYFDLLIYAGMLYFFYLFVEQRDISLTKKLFIIAPFIPLFFFAHTAYNLIGFDFSNCNQEALEGPLWQYVYFVEAFYVIWIALLGLEHIRKAKDKQHKRQIFFIMTGAVLFLLAFSSGNIVGSLSVDWETGQYGLFGMPIFLAFLSYLIVRYRSFGIQILGAQVLVATSTILVLAILLIRTIENVRVIAIITAVLILSVGYMLVRSVKREIEQRERIEKLAKELGVANEKLKGLDKLKSEFLSLASHQIRSPLTAIKGYASMLSEGAFGKLEEKQSGAVNTIFASAQGLVNVVEDFLNVSKIEQGGMKYEFAPTDLSKIVNGLVAEMKVSAENKRLDFSLSMKEGDTYMVKADAGKLKQVFLNLVDNAIKYTPNGFVRVALVRNKDKNTITFSVQDSGAGISPETKEKLFQKFNRGDGMKLNTNGSGLGLYLAREIARAHKGDVIIESAGLGKGSTFSVELPAV